VFENRVPNRIFEPKRVEVTRDQRYLHSLHTSPNIIRVIKSRMMRRQNAYQKKEMRTKLWQRNLKEVHYQEDTGVNERIILNLILKKQDGRV
jgi:hypothetical protein